MAKIDLKALLEPVSEDEPCGPDLDEAFDMDFMNFTAMLEGNLPNSYFSFDASALDFEGDYDKFKELLDKSRDLRLLVPLAKYRILERDLDAFIDTVEVIAEMLEARWEELHPKGVDGDYMLRMGPLYTLDEMPNCVLPLQGATLINSRRFGRITLRAIMLAEGDLKPREDEAVPSLSDIESAFEEAGEEERERLLGLARRLVDGLAAIGKTCVEKAGSDEAVSLDRLPDSAAKLVSAITRRMPGMEEVEGEGEGEPGAAGGPAFVPGDIADRSDVTQALYAAARYFALKEPTSPAALLLRQAERMVDSTFYDAVHDLVPDSASYSVLKLGIDPFFELTFDRMSSNNPAPDYGSELNPALSAEEYADGLGESVDDEEDETSEPAREPTPEEEAAAEAAEEEAAGDEATEEPAEEEAAEEEATEEVAEEEAAEEEPAEEETEEELAEEEPAEEEPAEEEAAEEEPAEEEPAEAPPAGRTVFVANTRGEALLLLGKVLAYYRGAEPTSPAPLLIQRAIDMSSRNFMDLLSDVLPPDYLKWVPKEE